MTTTELGAAQLGAMELGNDGGSSPSPPAPDPIMWSQQSRDPYVPKREVIGY